MRPIDGCIESWIRASRQAPIAWPMGSVALMLGSIVTWFGTLLAIDAHCSQPAQSGGRTQYVRTTFVMTSGLLTLGGLVATVVAGSNYWPTDEILEISITTAVATAALIATLASWPGRAAIAQPTKGNP